jgi:hypothetical protein
MKEKEDKAHIREIVRKAKKAEGCVWGIGERKWGRDFGRKMVIENVYGAEIWGWKKQGEVVREESKRNRLSESGKESGKVCGQNGGKEKLQDTNRILKRKEKNMEKKEERNTSRGTGVPVKKWKC